MTPENDYFSKYRVKNFEKKSIAVENIPIFEKEEKKLEEKEEPFSFNKYKPEKYSEESKFDSLLRQGTQYASRALEKLFGIIPDTKEFITDIILNSYEKAAVGLTGGEKQREAPQFLKKILGKEKSPFIGGFESGFTSPELREFSETATKGYTKPKTYAEEKIGGIVGDIASSLLGGKKSIKNNLLVPIGANLAENAIELTGADKDKQTFGKFGSWLLLGTTLNANANKMVFQMRNNARSALIPQTPTDLRILGNEIRPLNRKWIKGDPRTETAQINVKNLLKDIKSGKTNVEDLITKIDAINADIDLKGGFEYMLKTPGHVRKAEIKNLNELKDAIYKTIEKSTKNQPEFFKNYIDSQEAIGAVAQSNKLVDFAKKHYGKFISAGLGSLFGGVYFGHPVVTIAGSASLLALHKAAQVGVRMYKNPILRKYYINAIKASTENNIPVFIQNMSKLDHALEKEEKKKKPPYKFTDHQ